MSSKLKNNNIALIMGGVLAAVNVIVILIAGSPYDVAHKIGVYKMVPPVWMWCLSTVIFGFLIGYALGTVAYVVLSERTCREGEIWAYRGGMVFVGMYLLSLAHYPLLFVGERMVIALVLALLTLVCSLLCIFCWSRVSIAASIIMGVYTVWMAYVLFVSGYVVLNI